MKRIMIMMACVVGLLLPVTSFAAETPGAGTAPAKSASVNTANTAATEQIGVYVAPKFVYGLTQIDGVKLHASGGGAHFSRGMGSHTDSAFGGSLALGYDFSKKYAAPVRTELEYAAFSEVEAEKKFSEGGERMKMRQKYQIQTLLFNGYYDIDTGTQFSPYLGAGLGMAFVTNRARLIGENGSGGTGSETATNFAWNVGAGLGYDITERWTVDAGYRFVGLGDVKSKEAHVDVDAKAYTKTDYLYQHQFSLGLRHTF